MEINLICIYIVFYCVYYNVNIICIFPLQGKIKKCITNIVLFSLLLTE